MQRCCYLTSGESMNKIAITGTGRAGTQFITTAFAQAGLEVGHERLGRDGISSWCLVPPCPTRPLYGASFDQLPPVDLYHQIREPLACIASIMTIHGWNSWVWIEEQQFCRITPQDSLLLKAMKYYYEWNLLASERSIFSYRLENWQAALNRILEPRGIFPQWPKLEPVNTRKHDGLSWAQLEQESEWYSFLIEELYSGVE